MLTAALPLLQQAAAQKVAITVNNPSQLQRQDVVECDLQTICLLLGVSHDEPLTVRNVLQQEQPWQKSHDGKMLLQVSMTPGGQAVYTVERGKPEAQLSLMLPPPSQVYGRIYPERLDDLTWENDRGIYRFYGPALQRTGERSFGTDVWVKNTPEPVVEYRYRQHSRGWAKGDSLKKAGKRAEGEAVFRDASFHLDHGYGMDVYAVGASLGCGAPALMKDGQLIFPYCFKECKILDNGPLRFTAALTYGTTADGVTEHRLVKLDKGSHFNRMTVWYDGIKEPAALATGVVLHGGEAPLVSTSSVLYADPTDNPKVHQSQIFVGTLFPEEVNEARVLEGKPSHAIGIVQQYTGQPYTYYFGSAWSNYDVGTMNHWRLVAEETLQSIKTPLTVTITESK